MNMAMSNPGVVYWQEPVGVAGHLLCCAVPPNLWEFALFKDHIVPETGDYVATNTHIVPETGDYVTTNTHIVPETGDHVTTDF